MRRNPTGVTLSDNDRQEIFDAIQTIKTKLFFLTNISTDNSRDYTRLGDKKQPFATKSLELATQNKSLLLNSTNVEGRRCDYELFETLEQIYTSMLPLMELIEDTTAISETTKPATRTSGATIRTMRSATEAMRSATRMLNSSYQNLEVRDANDKVRRTNDELRRLNDELRCLNNELRDRHVKVSA